MNFPRGIAVDSTGNVYVADQNNHTILKIAPGGIVTTLAGLAGMSGNSNGTGSAARFNRPQGVAVDTAGTVYVADSGNNTIRQITPAGVVTTLAGQAGVVRVERWHWQRRAVRWAAGNCGGRHGDAVCRRHRQPYDPEDYGRRRGDDDCGLPRVYRGRELGPIQHAPGYRGECERRPVRRRYPEQHDSNHRPDAVQSGCGLRPIVRNLDSSRSGVEPVALVHGGGDLRIRDGDQTP